MQLISNSFKNGASIPEEFAFAKKDSRNHVALSTNRNPHLKWNGAPQGTKSFVLICCDYEVPSKRDDVNKEGRLVPATLPRIEFFHWFAEDKAMSGRYYGYDGPCPPWNDTLLHYYDFRLFALDVLRLETSGLLTGPVVKSALAGHVLGQAALLGTYSLNPNLKEDL
jgi:phosphatidylethanolamine-binding protein (PEBP) family uncharacterized protein